MSEWKNDYGRKMPDHVIINRRVRDELPPQKTKERGVWNSIYAHLGRTVSGLASLGVGVNFLLSERLQDWPLPENSLGSWMNLNSPDHFLLSLFFGLLGAAILGVETNEIQKGLNSSDKSV